MKRYSLLLLVGALFTFSGCAVVSNHSHSKIEGTKVSSETLSRIEIGETSKSWLISALGAPDSANGIEEGELLKYTSSRITKRHGHLLFVIDSSSERIEKETYYFEFKDGVLRRYWKEEV